MDSSNYMRMKLKMLVACTPSNYMDSSHYMPLNIVNLVASLLFAFPMSNPCQACRFDRLFTFHSCDRDQPVSKLGHLSFVAMSSWSHPTYLRTLSCTHTHTVFTTRCIFPVFVCMHRYLRISLCMSMRASVHVYLYV